jgi:hypothetical protein
VWRGAQPVDAKGAERPSPPTPDAADRRGVNGPRPDAQCPIRPGEPCTLCQLDVTGPQDCPLVYLVMTDPDLRADLHERRVRALAAAGGTQVPALPR